MQYFLLQRWQFISNTKIVKILLIFLQSGVYTLSILSSILQIYCIKNAIFSKTLMQYLIIFFQYKNCQYFANIAPFFYHYFVKKIHQYFSNNRTKLWFELDKLCNKLFYDAYSVWEQSIIKERLILYQIYEQ